MKDAFYFPHDSNAHDDPKIMKLLMEMKSSGYGIYWIVVELLRNEHEYTMNKSSYGTIAYQSHSDKESVRRVVEDFDLFVLSGDSFYSDSLKRRMIYLEERRKKLSDAGKLGNIRRWASGGDRNGIAVKESKVKESKVNKEKITSPSDFISEIKSLPAYQSIDVDTELRKMDGWLLAHPGRKKSKKFVVSWLNKNLENIVPCEVEPFAGVN